MDEENEILKKGLFPVSEFGAGTQLVDLALGKGKTIKELCRLINIRLATDHVRCREAEALGLQREIRDAGSRFRGILAEGFYKLVPIESSHGIDEAGKFNHDKVFLPYLRNILFEAFEAEHTDQFHPEQISQILKDEPRSLFCFLDAQHLSDLEIQRLRGFTQERHRVLLCGPPLGSTTDAATRRRGWKVEDLDIEGWIDRLRAGDPSARDALLACAMDRLERLTRKMLRGFPWEQTDDVLQNVILRLSRALQDITPPSSRDFFRLAAVQIRRELIDLARYHSGPQGLVEVLEIASDDPSRLAEWTEFHRQVEALPDEEREVVDLLFYQGLQQAEAATVLGVSERTVKRRWQSARLALHEALGGRLPGV